MTVRRGLSIGMLFALLASIGSALLLYKENQQQLTLEGNSLYTTQSIKVSASLNELKERLQPKAEGFSVYKNVDEMGMVRAVYSSDYGSTHYPIHRGRSITENNSKTALVGAGVELVERDSKSYYVLEGDEYEVVGYLGRHPQSLLQFDVLLADSSLFSNDSSEALVLDGQKIATYYAESFGDGVIEQMNQSTNRRTNIDFVSPILLALGFGVMIIGSIFIGLLAASFFHGRNRVGILIGRTRRYMSTLSAIQLAIPAATSITVVSLIWSSFSTTKLNHFHATLNFLWLVPLAALAMFVALDRKRKRH